jgi:hypothetical protein
MLGFYDECFAGLKERATNSTPYATLNRLFECGVAPYNPAFVLK